MVDAVRPVHRLATVQTGVSLRSGQIISARVDSLLSQGRVRLLVDGKSLIAKTSLALKPGQTIRASVETISGGTRLRVLSAADAAGNKAAAAEISPRQILSAALLRAGLSVPEAAELDRQAVLLSRSRGERSRLARLYAELRSRGADPSADFLEYLDAVLSPHSGSNPDNPENRSSQRQWFKPPDAEQLADELSDEAQNAPDGDDALLSLFNGAVSRDGTWVLRRFNRILDNRTLYCVIKFRKGIRPAMALTVQDGERIFEFLVEGIEKPRLTVCTNDRVVVDADSWQSFGQTLALMNILLSDTILPISESDGFNRIADETNYVLEAMGESS